MKEVPVAGFPETILVATDGSGSKLAIERAVDLTVVGVFATVLNRRARSGISGPQEEDRLRSEAGQ